MPTGKPANNFAFDGAAKDKVSGVSAVFVCVIMLQLNTLANI